MKISIGHFVSLGVNGILAAALVANFVMQRDRGRGAPEMQGRAPVFSPAVPVPSSTDYTIAPKPPAARVVIGGDWHGWLETLRAAGVPTSVLVTLVREDFDRRWQVKEAETQRKYRQGLLDADGLALTALQHDVELENETRAALGEDVYRRWDMECVLQSFNVHDVPLSASERAAIYDCQCRLRDRTREAQMAKLQRTIDPATFDSRQHAAEEERDQRLRALLGDRRASLLQGEDTIDDVKRSLSGLSISDGQLQELADLQRQWDKTHSDLSALETSTQETKYSDALRDAEGKWRADLERILGSDGAQRYLQAQDSRYIEMKRFATDWKLSPTEVDRVYSTIADFEDAVREYSRDARSRDVDPLSLETMMKQFAQHTEESLQKTLGPERYQQLKLNGIAPTLSPYN